MMTKEDIDRLIEQVKTSSARRLPHRLALVINDLDLAVSLGLITWASIADSLGVHRNSLRSARRRARELFDEWSKTGVFDKLNNPAGASNVSNVRRDNNGGVERLQSGNNVRQSYESSMIDSSGNGVVDESKARLLEALRKSKSDARR